MNFVSPGQNELRLSVSNTWTPVVNDDHTVKNRVIMETEETLRRYRVKYTWDALACNCSVQTPGQERCLIAHWGDTSLPILYTILGKRFRRVGTRTQPKDTIAGRLYCMSTRYYVSYNWTPFACNCSTMRSRKASELASSNNALRSLSRQTID